MEPFTYGIIMGLGETFLAGKQAEQKQLIEEQKAKATATADAQKTFVDFGVNQNNSQIIQQQLVAGSPAFMSLLGQLPDHSRSAIILNGMRELPLSDIHKEFLTGINGTNGTAVARGLLVDRNVMDSLQQSAAGKSVISLITAKAVSGLSQQEQSMWNDLPDDLTKRFLRAEEYIGSGNYPSGTPFGDLIRTIQQPKRELKYEPLGAEDINSIRASLIGTDGKKFDEATDESLQVLRAARARILPFVEPPKVSAGEDEMGVVGGYIDDPDFVPHPEAFKDLLHIDIILSQFGTKDFNNEAMSLTEMLDSARNQLDGSRIPDQGARISFANETLRMFNDMPGFADLYANAVENGPNTKGALTSEQFEDFNVLASMAEEVNKVDSNVYSYGGTRVNTGKSIQEAPDAWLFNLEGKIKPGFLDDLSLDEKQQFESDLKQALITDADNRRTQKDATGASTPAPARDYRTVLPKIKEAIPQLFNDTLKNMGFPEDGEAAGGVGNVPADQIAQNGTPLPETQLKLSTGQIINIDPAAVKFANSMNMSTHDLFKSDLHYQMLDLGSNNPARIYNAVNSVNDSGIFLNTVDREISQNSAVQLSQIFAAQGIFDRNQQLDVIAAVMSGDIPNKFKKAPFDYAMSQANFDGMMKQAMGTVVDLKDISKLNTNTDSFLSIAREVRARLEALPDDGSAISDEVSAFILNLAGVRGNLVSQAFTGTGNFLKELGIFKEDDVREADGFSAAEQSTRIQDTAAEFMASDFLKNNALLKQALVTLAYTYAKTMDPSGRISERDFTAALDVVRGGSLAVRGTQIATVQNLIDKAIDNRTFYGRTFNAAVEASAGGQTYRPTTAVIKRMRAMRYYRQVEQNTIGIQKVNTYNKDVANLSFRSTEFNAKYFVQLATSKFGARVATNKKIYRVKLKERGFNQQNKSASDFISGVPLYVDSDGRILKRAEIQQLLGMSS